MKPSPPWRRWLTIYHTCGTMLLGQTGKKKLHWTLLKICTKDYNQILPVNFSHINQVFTLEFHHRDPFDRMIIAQSITEDLTIISKDKNFSLYPIKLLW